MPGKPLHSFEKIPQLGQIQELIILDQHRQGLNGELLCKILEKVSSTLISLTLEDKYSNGIQKFSVPNLPKLEYFHYDGMNLKTTVFEDLMKRLPNLKKFLVHESKLVLSYDRPIKTSHSKLQELWSNESLINTSVFYYMNINFPYLTKLLVKLDVPKYDDGVQVMTPETYFAEAINGLTALKGLKQLFLQMTLQCFGHRWNYKLQTYLNENSFNALWNLTKLAEVTSLSISCTSGNILPWMGEIFLKMPKLKRVTLYGTNMAHVKNVNYLQPLWDKGIQIHSQTASAHELFQTESTQDW